MQHHSIRLQSVSIVHHGRQASSLPSAYHQARVVAFPDDPIHGQSRSTARTNESFRRDSKENGRDESRRESRDQKASDNVQHASAHVRLFRFRCGLVFVCATSYARRRLLSSQQVPRRQHSPALDQVRFNTTVHSTHRRVLQRESLQV